MYTENRNRQGGGIEIFAKNTIKCKVIHEMCTDNDCFESIFLECGSGSTFIVGAIYRRPNSNIHGFNSLLDEVLEKIKLLKKVMLLAMGYECKFIEL